MTGRGVPNAERPRLSDEAERRLLPLDQLARKAYTKIEDGVERARRMLASGLVLREVEATDSVAHDLRVAAARANDEDPTINERPPRR